MVLIHRDIQDVRKVFVFVLAELLHARIVVFGEVKRGDDFGRGAQCAFGELEMKGVVIGEGEGELAPEFKPQEIFVLALEGDPEEVFPVVLGERNAVLHLGGVLRGLLPHIDARHTVGDVREGERHTFGDEGAVLQLYDAAADDVLRPESLLHRVDLLCGDLRGGTDDEIARFRRMIVIVEGVGHLLRRHPDARGKAHAHEHHQKDGDEARHMPLEHPCK